MSDLNSVNLIGRLVREIEMKQTASGVNVGSFSLAVNEKFKDTEHTSFFDCVVFGKQAETLSQYVQKGHRIGITGKAKQQRWNDKDTGKGRSNVEIIVQSFMFLQSKNEAVQETVIPDTPFNDADLPF